MVKKIKILQLTTDSKIGGTEQMLIQLSKNYDRKKYELIFVTLLSGGPLLEIIQKHDNKTYCLNFKNKFDLPKLFKLYKILKKEKPDILNTYLFHSHQIGRIIGKLAGIKKIVSSYRSPDYWKKWYHKILDSATSLLADKIIPNSELVKQTLVKTEKINKKKIFVVNNGILLNDRTYELPKIYKKYHIPENKKIIGIVANLTPVKNHTLFLSICENLNKKFNDLFFVIAGLGPELDNIRSIAKQKKITNIIFTGYCDNVRELLKIFDIFVLTSKWESSPRSILEAMAEKIPVVASNVGGIPELVENNITGFLCKHDVEEFSNKISEILTNNELKNKFILNSLNKIKKNFLFDTFLKKTFHIYDELYTKKIKILEIVTRLNIGGPAVNVLYLTSMLDKNKFEVKLITGTEEEYEGNMYYLAEKLNVVPIKIQELKRELNFKNDLIAFFKLIKTIYQFKPDIIHTHMAKAGTLGRLSGILTFTPNIVHTFHGHIFDGYFSALKSNIFLNIERFLAKFCKKLISVSNSQKKDFIELKLGNDKKIINIPLGLELSEFSNVKEKNDIIRKKYHIENNTIVIGIVARIVPIKNHQLLVEAATKLKKIFDNFVVFVAGDGDLRNNIEDSVKKNKMEKNFIFAGFIQDLTQIYSICDIVVLTSKNEGLPTVIIEAQACKIPVISTNVGGVEDLIEDNVTGLLVEPDNGEELKNKLYKLCTNLELRKKIGENGFRTSIKKYSIETLINNFENFYTSLVYRKK